MDLVRPDKLDSRMRLTPSPQDEPPLGFAFVTHQNTLNNIAGMLFLERKHSELMTTLTTSKTGV
jgi:hypothetical protein